MKLGTKMLTLKLDPRIGVFLGSSRIRLFIFLICSELITILIITSRVATDDVSAVTGMLDGLDITSVRLSLENYVCVMSRTFL